MEEPITNRSSTPSGTERSTERKIDALARSVREGRRTFEEALAVLGTFVANDGKRWTWAESRLKWGIENLPRPGTLAEIAASAKAWQGASPDFCLDTVQRWTWYIIAVRGAMGGAFPIACNAVSRALGIDLPMGRDGITRGDKNHKVRQFVEKLCVRDANPSARRTRRHLDVLTCVAEPTRRKGYGTPRYYRLTGKGMELARDLIASDDSAMTLAKRDATAF